MALRLAEDDHSGQIRTLLYREIGSHEALEGVRWIDVHTTDGLLRALTFYAEPSLLDFHSSNRSLTEVAHALARACGHWGSGAEYLFNTLYHLESLGIYDDNLWELQDLVAQEIETLYRP